MNSCGPYNFLDDGFGVCVRCDVSCFSCILPTPSKIQCSKCKDSDYLCFNAIGKKTSTDVGSCMSSCSGCSANSETNHY